MEPLEMKKDKGPYENNNVYDFIKIWPDIYQYNFHHINWIWKTILV
jgi:hypothetical protein